MMPPKNGFPGYTKKVHDTLDNPHCPRGEQLARAKQDLAKANEDVRHVARGHPLRSEVAIRTTRQLSRICELAQTALACKEVGICPLVDVDIQEYVQD